MNAMDAETILTALANKYRGPEWAFFKEVRCGTGYSMGARIFGREAPGRSPEKRLDAYAFHLWPSGGYMPHVFEIKITRSDFLREMKRPKKYVSALALSQFFYYVTPKGLVQPDEVPDEAGLIWVAVRHADPPLYCRMKKKAPDRGLPEFDWAFFASICRRVADAGWKTPPKHESDDSGQLSLFSWYRNALWRLQSDELRKKREANKLEDAKGS